LREHPQFKLTPAFRYGLGLVCEACADRLDPILIRRAVLDVEMVGGGRHPYGKLKHLEEMLGTPDDRAVKVLLCVRALADLLMSENTNKPEESQSTLEALAAVAGYVPVLRDDHWVRHLHGDNRTPWFPDSTIGAERPYLNPDNTRSTWALRLGDGWWGHTGRRVVGLGPLNHPADIVADDDTDDSNDRLWDAADLLKLYIAEGFAAAWAKAETVGELKALRCLVRYEQHGVDLRVTSSGSWNDAHQTAIDREMQRLTDEASP
jgi:hypothetical protein